MQHEYLVVPKLLISGTPLEPARTALCSTDELYGAKLSQFHLLHPVFLLTKGFYEKCLY